MSVNVTGDCACGPDGGGSFAGPDEPYDLPVRAGAGEAAGCWHKTVGVAVNNRKDKTSRDAVSWASSCRKLIYGSYQQHKHDASPAAANGFNDLLRTAYLYAGSRRRCKSLRWQKYLFTEEFSRKGAKAQSAAASQNGFVCAFAPLREKNVSHRCDFSTFLQSLVRNLQFTSEEPPCIV